MTLLTDIPTYELGKTGHVPTQSSLWTPSGLLYPKPTGVKYWSLRLNPKYIKCFIVKDKILINGIDDKMIGYM